MTYFSFRSLSPIKPRPRNPSVVVSSAAYNNARPDVILMAITGQLSGYFRIGEVVINDWKTAGLLKPSTVKPILITIQKTLVVRPLGNLTQRDVIAMRDALKAIPG